MKSKLFLVALAAFVMGAFAMVGCESAAEPAAETGTTGTAAGGDDKTATPETAEPPAEGGEAKTDEAGAAAGTEGGDATKTEGGDAAHTDGSTHTEGDGH